MFRNVTMMHSLEKLGGVKHTGLKVHIFSNTFKTFSEKSDMVALIMY